LNPKVAIVLLNWNGWRDTSCCLSCLRQLHYDNFEVIVVDNGSTDDSVLQIRDQFPWVTLLETGKNLGFAGGCNVGIRHALRDGADFVWLLNTDTKLDSNTLDALMTTARREERIGAVGAAIYSMAEPDQLQAWGGGSVNFWLGRSRHFLRPVHDNAIEYITGASLLLRGSALRSVGLLDDSFFFFWEDADLGFRLRKAKWKLAVAGAAKVWHRQSASLRGRDALLDTYFNQAAKLFFRKHALVPQIPLYVGMTLRVMKRLISRDWERARAVWAASRQT